MREELARFTQEGVVLTPRPEWAGEGDELNLRGHPACSSMERAADVMRRAAEGAERITVLESEVSDLKAEAAKAREEAAGEVALRVTAQEVSHKLAGQLQEITDRPRAEAACGCPEPPADGQGVMVEPASTLCRICPSGSGCRANGLLGGREDGQGPGLDYEPTGALRCSVVSRESCGAEGAAGRYFCCRARSSHPLCESGSLCVLAYTIIILINTMKADSRARHRLRAVTCNRFAGCGCMRDPASVRQVTRTMARCPACAPLALANVALLPCRRRASQ